MKACIFDLDGTLTSTLDSIHYSVNETLKEMEISPITKEECRQFVGDGARCLMERTLQRTGDQNVCRIEEAMEIYGRIFDENCTYLVQPYEGIEDMLRELKARGIKLAVLSNKPHPQTVKVVREVFGEGIFSYVQGQMEGVPKKPDPTGVWLLEEKMGISKEACIYVGDSEVDIRTGSAAGAKTIGVLWGFRSKEALLGAGAKNLITHPKELLNYL